MKTYKFELHHQYRLSRFFHAPMSFYALNKKHIDWQIDSYYKTLLISVDSLTKTVCFVCRKLADSSVDLASKKIVKFRSAEIDSCRKRARNICSGIDGNISTLLCGIHLNIQLGNFSVMLLVSISGKSSGGSVKKLMTDIDWCFVLRV